MTVTTKDVERLRGMINEPETGTYSDEALAEVIARYVLLDERGQEPYTFSSSGAGSPQRVANPVWMPAYDLNAAAADIWDEKLAKLVDEFDFTADGAKFELSQKAENYRERAKYFRMRRAPRSIKVFPLKDKTLEGNFPWIGNLPEEE